MPARFQGVTLLREDGSATYHLASVVDDLDFAITHVLRGNDHRPNEALHRALSLSIGGSAPEYIHYGLILGPDGKKMIRGGTTQKIVLGSMYHIPINTPHQVVPNAGRTVTYWVTNINIEKP